MNITEAENAFRGIQQAFEDEKKAKSDAKTAKDMAREMLAKSDAELKASIEDPLSVSGSEVEAMVKLQRIEAAWQHAEEAKDGAKELKGAARDALKEARKKLDEAIKDSKQLGFAGF